MGSSEAASQRVGRSTDANSPEATRDSADCSPSFRNRSYGATKMYNTEAMESVRLLAAGGVAGAVSKTCTAPLARLTILYQVNGLDAVVGTSGRIGMLQAFQQVIRREGAMALWKGNGVTIVHRLPYSAVNFWAYERATQLWLQHYPPPAGVQQGAGTADMLRRLVAGGAAGLCACTLAYPLDLVRTRLSAQTKTQYYTGIVHALRTIVRDEGARGLYRGLGATLLQVTPSLAINYTAYGTLRSYWLQSHGNNSHTVTMSLMCGGAAGLISSTATFPLDLIRRRMQLEGQAGTRRYKGYADVARSVMANGGLRGFYAGILPEYFKVIPGVAIGYCTYEFMRKSLGVQTNPGAER
ncbi:g2956 [Coccomyxa elongata]